MLKDAFNCGIKKVFIACGRTDLRMGIDGLSNLIRTRFNKDPLEEGTLFLFCGNRRNTIKGLLFEGDGFLLLTKRLTEGSFVWPASPDEMENISSEQFKILMDSYNAIILRRKIRETAQKRKQSIGNVPPKDER